MIFGASRQVLGPVLLLVLVCIPRLISAQNQNSRPTRQGSGVGVQFSGISHSGGQKPNRTSAHPRARSMATNGSATPATVTGGLFQQVPLFPTQASANAVAAGDFNGDGNLDVAVAGGDGVTILLGDGHGNFQPGVLYTTVGTDNISLAVADFNGDGKLDLAVANYNLVSRVSVFLGNGDGTFQTQVDYPSESCPQSVAVGDFNGDGHPDLAVANGCSGTVSVFLNKGDGTFKPYTDYAIPNAGSNSVVVADFNHDGKLDIATTSDGAAGNWVSVLLGNGDGTFQPHVDYADRSTPESLAVADLNGDGFPDLVVGHNDTFTNFVSVLLNKGDGTFQPHVDYATVFDPQFLAVGDFNGDGKVDVVASNGGSMGILLGNGDGTLQSHAIYSCAGAIVAGDFNSDGYLDLFSEGGELFLGNGNGTFPAANVDYIVSETGHAIFVAAGDFNGDGKLDLVATSNNDPAGPAVVSVLIGNGDGTFQPPVDYSVGAYPSSIAVADFNVDGKLDIITVGSTGASVLIGNGDGTFKPHVDYAAAGGSVAVGDFNGDRKPDLVIGSSGSGSGVLPTSGSVVSVLLNKGDGTFQPAVNYSSGNFPAYSVTVGDFNGDGKLDLAVANGCEIQFLRGCIANGYVSVLLGNGDGTFQSPVNYSATNPSYILAVKLNSAGNPDLVLVDSGSVDSGSVYVLLNNGDATFQAPVSYQTPLAFSLAPGDFNGDGRVDVAVTGAGVSVLLGNGDDTLQPSQNYVVGAGPESATVGDFNGDGAPDLALGNVDGTITILLNLNRTGTIVALQSSANPSVFSQAVTFNAAVKPVKPGQPTGTITFFDGTTALGNSNLDASGAATFATTTLTTARHAVTAAYSGDNNFSASTSTVLYQVVVAPDFGLSANPLSGTVTPGTIVNFTISATAMNGFNSPASLTCSVSPAPELAPTCALSPATVTPTSNGSTAKLTISTFAPTASLNLQRPGHSWLPIYALWLPLSGVALLAFCFSVDHRKKKKALGFIFATLLFEVLTLQMACGGSASTKPQGGTPAGDYTVRIQAASGSIIHTTSVTLTVR